MSNPHETEQYITLVSEELTEPANWVSVVEHIDGHATIYPRLIEALRKSAAGAGDARDALESVLADARDELALRYVERYLAGNPDGPFPSAALMAKHCGRGIPQAALLADVQLRMAA